MALSQSIHREKWAPCLMIMRFCCGSALEAQSAGTRAAANKTERRLLWPLVSVVACGQLTHWAVGSLGTVGWPPQSLEAPGGRRLALLPRRPLPHVAEKPVASPQRHFALARRGSPI